jgi:hypothetical protein
MCRSILKLASALILIGLTTPPSRADLTVTLDNVTLAAGGTGMMNISITSDSSVALDTLSSFGLELMISPVGTPASILTFTETQADPMANPNYVFPTQSTDVALGIPFWSVPTTPPPITTISGGDEDNFGASYVSIPSATGEPGTYLATVQFASPMGGGAPAGDMFQISLVPDAGLTYFDDQNGNALNYSVVGGLVTIGPSSVPEPSTMTLTLVGLGGSLGLWWRRRSKSPGRAIGRSGRLRGAARSWRR